MFEAVKSYLAALGITVSGEPNSSDENLITFLIEKVEFYIQARTNLKLVPEELTNVAIDMVVGEFLSSKHSLGLLNITALNFEAIVKQVQDGDTNVSYAVSDKYSPEALFNTFIERLRHEEVKWSDYRVLAW